MDQTLGRRFPGRTRECAFDRFESRGIVSRHNTQGLPRIGHADKEGFGRSIYQVLNIRLPICFKEHTRGPPFPGFAHKGVTVMPLSGNCQKKIPLFQRTCVS